MRIALTLAIGLAIWSADLSLAHAANVNDFIDFSLRAQNNSLLLPGRLYIPPQAITASARRPLILFLHGAGESGTNNLGQLSSNMDNLLAEAKQRAAFLYAPQTNETWRPTSVTTNIDTMLSRAFNQFHVDTSRVYVTGLSMGGGGVWDMLNRYGDRFAAAVPICAVSPSADFLSARILEEPIWAFHARNDTTVLVSTTRNVVSSTALAAGEMNPTFPSARDTTSLFHYDSLKLDFHYTEPATGGHGIWSGVYATEPMYDWLFAHAVVPEPATIALLASGAVFLLRRRSRAAFPTS